MGGGEGVHTSVVDSGVKRKMSSSLVLERWVVVCHRCWELNSGPMQEQYVLSTAQPSPQPHELCIFGGLVYQQR